MPNEQLVNHVKLQHQQWLSHPVTQAVFIALGKHKSDFINGIALVANNPSVSSESIRYQANAIRTVMAIEEIIKNPDLLINKISDKKE